MRASSIAAVSDASVASRCTARVIEIWLRPVQALIAAPTLLFLAALTAMLFCHPDLSFHWVSRAAFALLVLSVAARALTLRQEVLRFERASWPMIALIPLVLISLIGRPIDEDTWSVLAAKYIFPFTLFHLAQLVFTEERQVRRFESFALAVLAYLSFTAIVFLLAVNALVFPKFILDANLGIHIDRARGPFLQAVANGMALNMLALLVLHGYRRGGLHSVTTLVVLASVPIAIVATMTRAVWLSFAGSLLTLLLLSKTPKGRLIFVTTLIIAVAGLGVVLGTTQLGGVLDDRLEDSQPIEFRQAVYAGAWQMFLDRPFTGWGFHQMPADLPKYVGEFHEAALYPHNTYLEILVENGVLGFSLYIWMMWELWRLGRRRMPEQKASLWINAELRCLWPIFLAVYWVNAAVVVMSYQFVNGILFTVAGILAAQRRVEATRSC